ncbi:hypothetical protein DPMN_169341 [Dreissena polymorpha]|uniref:Uncharacterized protein n=1 Tax=Dreissena polymorpha TaxID=45954 RepID=A0A9D4DUH5_DREPO|nr:hypothetical protein DPMN_169341 [Dreissena polymorpha]
MVAVRSPWTSCGRRSNLQKMIIDFKATVRRFYCDFSTFFVRLLRHQKDYGVLTATSLRPYGVYYDPTTTMAFLLRPQCVFRDVLRTP